AVRRALGDDKSKHRYIETVTKRGYRFVMPVTELASESPRFLVQRRIRARIVTEEEYPEGNEVLSLTPAGTSGAPALPAAAAPGRFELPAALRPRSSRKLPAGLLTLSILLTAAIGLVAYLKFRKHEVAAAAPRAVRASLLRLTSNAAADE